MSCLRNQNYEPNVLVILFDTLIKPIILYGSEVWGGFGIKGSASVNTEALWSNVSNRTKLIMKN